MLAGRQTIVIEANEDYWFGDFMPCPAYCYNGCKPSTE
jgi:hypothetical protein